MENPYQSPTTASAAAWNWSRVLWSRPSQVAVGMVALVGLLAIIAFLKPVIVWDGSFNVIIAIHSRSSQAVKQVSCAFAFRRADAEWLAQSDSFEATLAFRPIQEFDGKNYVAHGQSSGREWWGIDYGYTAHQFIVVCVDCADGKQVTSVVEIVIGRFKGYHLWALQKIPGGEV